MRHRRFRCARRRRRGSRRHRRQSRHRRRRSRPGRAWHSVLAPVNAAAAAAALDSQAGCRANRPALLPRGTAIVEQHKQAKQTKLDRPAVTRIGTGVLLFHVLSETEAAAARSRLAEYETHAIWHKGKSSSEFRRMAPLTDGPADAALVHAILEKLSAINELDGRTPAHVSTLHSRAHGPC